MKHTHHQDIIRRLKLQRDILIIAGLTIIGIYFVQPKIISPCPDTGCGVLVKTVYAKDSELTINQEIYKVFGVYGDRAMKLLTGQGCSENKSLNPTAINVNKDVVGSKDFGVFQINNYWQGVSNTKFLLDPHINIQMAYKIFVDSGYSFKMWTCGKYHNI